MWGELAALGSAACWSVASLLFERVGKTRVNAGAINLTKCVFGSLVLLGATLATQGRALPEGIKGTDLGLLGASAVVGLAVGDTAFFAALKELGAPRSLLLLSMAPAFVVGLEALLEHQAPPGRDLAGIGLALAGLAMVLWKPGEGFPSLRGVGWGLLAALGQAGGNLLSRAGTRGALDALSASWFRLAVGSAGVLLAGLWGGQLAAWYHQVRPPETLRKLLIASFFGTALGLLLMQAGLSYSRSGGVASALISLSPIFSLPLAHWTGSEKITLRSALGALIALVGVVWLLR